MILITGNLGYIGQRMTRFFQKQGHEVSGIDSQLYRGCDFSNGAPPLTKQLIKDVRDVSVNDLKGAQTVIHLAALSTDYLGEMNPALTYDINETASVKLAELSREAGVERYIFSSSCSLYGVADNARPIDEAGKLNPLTAYAKAKANAEEQIVRLANDDFHPVLMRNATVYGVSPAIRLDLVVNVMVACAMLKNEVTIFGDGEHWRPLVHVEDLCRAFQAVHEAPVEAIHNQAFNVGVPDENYQVKDIALRVKEALPEQDVAMMFTPGEGGRTYRVDCSKLGAVIPSYQPQWNLDSGIQELIAAYREKGLSLQGFESDKFFRIKRIKSLMQEQVLNEDLRFSS